MNLQEISDRLEIQDLMVEYSYAIDKRNWDALDELFTPDAIIDFTEVVGVKGGLPEIKTFLAESLSPFPSSCQHIISTSQIKVEGDRAHGRTICTSPVVMGTDGHVFFMGFWYRDEFVRTPKGWRISSRYEESCWNYNVPAGLLESAGRPS